MPEINKDELSAADRKFRREVAVALLAAWVAKYGGFSDDERTANMRLIWKNTDAFLALENATEPVSEPVPVEEVPVKRKRAAHPTDEWAVVSPAGRKRGFVSREEAEQFAGGKPDAQVIQVGGPEVTMAVATA